MENWFVKTKRPAPKLLFTVIIYLLLFSAGFAAPDNKKRVLRFSIKLGLSFGVVNSVAQDANGFMWFATTDGLNQFDGNTFKVFKYNPDDKHSISGNYIKAVLKDRDGTIWASSRNGLNEFVASKEQFIHHVPSAQAPGISDDISDISLATNKDLWVSLNGSGFASFNRQNRRFRFYNQQTVAGLKTNSILNVFEDSKGLIWLGTRDSGIEVFRIDKSRRLTRAGLDLGSLPKTRINQVYEDHFHNIWIASANGLFFFNRAEGRFYNIPLKTFHQSNIYLSLHESEDKKLLVGVQDGGLYSLDLNLARTRRPENFLFTLVTDTREQGITQRSVQSIFRDKDDNIWLGTYGEGIYMISSIAEKFRLFEKKIADLRAESYLRYYGMCADRDGNLWLGTDGDGIYKTNPSGQVIRHYSASEKSGSIKDGAIISAYRDSGGNLWFGSYSKGLFLYRPSSDSFLQFAHQPEDPLSIPSNDVRVIFEDARKNIWIGTNGGGLARMDPHHGTFTRFLPSNSSINANDVRAIAEDKRGNLWIGTYGGGLNYLDTRTMRFSRYFNDPSEKNYLSNHIIFSLHLDSLGRLFVGSEGNGLLVFDTEKKTVKSYSENSGLNSNVINAIQPENRDKVWVSTNKGLSRINLASGKVENFDQSDGIQSGQFNPGSVLYNEKYKYICFGGTEGWNLFYPEQIRTSLYHPKVMITGIQLFGKKVEVGKGENGRIILNEQIGNKTRIILQPDQSVFSIQYTSLNYAYADRSNFAYMLEGLDKNWNFVQNEHAATYRYLPPGKYLFKVKSSNQDGVWFEDYASVYITVLPAWYQTWWAYLIYLAAALLVLYYYQQYRIRQASLKYEIQRAQFETLKEKELNEKKISYFTNISHEFRTPLTLIINPVRELMKEGQHDHASLNIIHRNAKRLLSLVDQLLLFRKADQNQEELNLDVVQVSTLIREVFQCFLHQAEQKNIQYAFICEDESIEITADIEKLEIALFNLISNALKFTPENGRVSVSLTQSGEKIRILVSDSGVGIPKDAGDKIYSVFHQYPDKRLASKGGFGIGLFLAKTFILKHLGELGYESEPGKGTTFRIDLWKQHPQLTAGVSPVKQPVTSVLLEELSDASVDPSYQTAGAQTKPRAIDEELRAGKATMLLVDDDAEILEYLVQIFKEEYDLLQAFSGETALELIKRHKPDIVLSDVMMDGLSGIDLCTRMKSDLSTSHIPVVLLTASSSQEYRLQGIEGGADDYISKPFDKDLLMARVGSILKNRSDLQKYFYNEITLQSNDFKISAEYREFLQRCILVVERHMTDPLFNIKVLASEIGMSHSTLYNRIKSISGQSTNSFIRFIRLRKAAQLLITTDITISEAAYQVGINDIKYFREQFSLLFGMRPSEYIKKYRKPFHQNHPLNKDIFKVK